MNQRVQFQPAKGLQAQTKRNKVKLLCNIVNENHNTVVLANVNKNDERHDVMFPNVQKGSRRQRMGKTTPPVAKGKNICTLKRAAPNGGERIARKYANHARESTQSIK